MSLIELGPFSLHNSIGAGGMAEVWKGVHRDQQVPVAAKIMTASRTCNRDQIQAFRNEVQAVAGLSHPSIVMVFDHGEVDSHTSQTSNGQISEGSPYLVMELASGGSLDQVQKPLDWTNLKGILLVLLDALAHAHARGVIHRDLKPGNILLCNRHDIRPGLKISDFGIAYAIEQQNREGSFEVSMGTPCYMAPEQFEGTWRDYGPHTDLYALGCLAYELAVGHVPYEGNNLIQLAHLHLTSEIPKIENDNLPRAFNSWIRNLLTKNPVKRFQTAADAAWELAQLGTPTEEGSWSGRDLLFDQSGIGIPTPDVAFRDTQLMDDNTFQGLFSHNPNTTQDPKPVKYITQTGYQPETLPHPDTRGSLTGHSPGDSRYTKVLAPLPLSWKLPGSAPPKMKLVGTGLGLYGLRSIPLVDRDKERNIIWQALADTREHCKANLILLNGAAGNGKSRLAEWMAQRAHEVGTSIVLQARHSPNGGPADGLPRMVSRQLRCVGLNRSEMLERCKNLLHSQGVQDDYEWNALTEIMLSATEKELAMGVQRIRFASPQERYALIRRLIERLGRERPVIAWIDDVQWAPDTLSFVEHVLNHQQTNPSPILFLLTVRDEALAMQPLATRRLDEIMTYKNTRKLAILPLAASDRKALVQELLGLEGELGRRVEERTCGNPLFAVQLVGDWVYRGVLEVGDRGFKLRKGEQAILPDDLYHVWTTRIEQLLFGLPKAASVALQVAAIIGGEVNPIEWEFACGELDLDIPDVLVKKLFDQRLAIPSSGGWIFAHGILRETLQRRASESGRFIELNIACAQMLRNLYPSDQRGVAERIGNHLAKAGSPEEAIELLLRGARERRESSEFREAHDILARRDELMGQSGIPESDPRWGEGWVLKSWVFSNQGKLSRAWEYSERAEIDARTHGWEKILPQAQLGMGVAARDRGEIGKAKQLTQDALKGYSALGNRMGVAHGLQGLGVIHWYEGKLTKAESLIKRAMELHELIENPFGVAQCALRLSEVTARHAKLQKSEQYALEALKISRELSERLSEANCINALGDVARFRNELKTARKLYLKAVNLFEHIGSTSVLYAKLNLGLTALTNGDYRHSEELLEPLETKFIKQENYTAARMVTTALLACAAANNDPELWARCSQKLKQPEGQELIDCDLARCFEWAGQLAFAQGWSRRGRFALQLAEQQRKKLGHTEKVKAIAQVLKQFSDQITLR